MVMDLHMESPAVTSFGGSLTSTEEINSLKKKKRARKKKQGKAVKHKDKGPDLLLANSSLKTDTVVKDPLHESPALPNLLSSQNIVEFNSKKKNKRRKRQKTKHEAIESNVPALDMPSEHPIQCLSVNPATSQSCVERDICQGENEEKEQNTFKKDAEKSKGECDFQEVSCTRDSVIANAECSAKESLLEVVKLNSEQSINDNSSNSEDKSGFVKNESKAKMYNDYPLVYRFSGKYQYAKTYSRRKRDDSYDGRNSGDLSSVKFNEEPGMLDHHKDVSDLSIVSTKDSHSKIPHFSLDGNITSNTKNKLLILDVNGLLADFVSYVPQWYKPQPDLRLKRKKVYKRPFCDDFLQFCFDKFHVGVWSSRHKSNVDKVIDLLMGESASKLLFCWDQSHCTTTKFSTVENSSKPLVLKELRKLWDKVDLGLPWEKGQFNESNTLLLDDSPYKALVNPRHTAVFPYSYQYNDQKDASLGPGGDLRVYLEGLAMADNVQQYVSSNPFGQRPITESNPSWGYYRKVIEAVKRRQNAARPS